MRRRPPSGPALPHFLGPAAATAAAGQVQSPSPALEAAMVAADQVLPHLRHSEAPVAPPPKLRAQPPLSSQPVTVSWLISLFLCLCCAGLNLSITNAVVSLALDLTMIKRYL